MDPNDEGKMERAKKFLGLSQDESEAVSRLAVPERQAGEGKSFYDTFALAGNRVVRVEPGLIVCNFKVPPRLTVSHSFGCICKYIFELISSKFKLKMGSLISGQNFEKNFCFKLKNLGNFSCSLIIFSW